MAKYKIRHSSRALELGFDSNGMMTSTGYTNGAKNGSTVSCSEFGIGGFRSTKLTLASTPVTVANVTGASFGGLKLYDFPQCKFYLLGGYASLSFNWDGQIAAAGSGDFGLGTTITADATIATTDVDLMASTAMLDPFVSGVGSGLGYLVTNTAFDGSVTAKDMNINIIVDDADVGDADSDIILVTGTIQFNWVNNGLAA
jgi:hypothetical protein